MSEDLRRIAAALKTALEMFEMGSRQSGRTERMLAQLKPGHRIICADPREAERLRRQVRERGIKDVVITSADPKLPLLAGPFARDRCRPTTADHDWIYKRFMAAIRDVEASIEHELRMISGARREMPQWPEAAEEPLRSLEYGPVRFDGKKL